MLSYTADEGLGACLVHLQMHKVLYTGIDIMGKLRLKQNVDNVIGQYFIYVYLDISPRWDMCYVIQGTDTAFGKWLVVDFLAMNLCGGLQVYNVVIRGSSECNFIVMSKIWSKTIACIINLVSAVDTNCAWMRLIKVLLSSCDFLLPLNT